MISLSSESYIIYTQPFFCYSAPGMHLSAPALARTPALACIRVHLHWPAFTLAPGLHSRVHLPLLLACSSAPALACFTAHLPSLLACTYYVHFVASFFSCFWMWSCRCKMQSFIMMKPASDQSLDFIFCYWLWYFLVIFPSGFADFIKATTSYSYTGPVLFYFNI